MWERWQASWRKELTLKKGVGGKGKKWVSGDEEEKGGHPGGHSRLVSTTKRNTRNTRKPICFPVKGGTRAFPRC